MRNDNERDKSPEIIQAMEDFLRAPSLEALEDLRLRLDKIKTLRSSRLCELAGMGSSEYLDCPACPLYDGARGKGMDNSSNAGDLCDIFYDEALHSSPEINVAAFWAKFQGLVVLNVARFVELLRGGENGQD